MRRSKPPTAAQVLALEAPCPRPPRVLEPHEVGSWITWGRLPDRLPKVPQPELEPEPPK